MKTFRAVIIGAGIIAKTHTATLKKCKQTTLVAIADIDIDKANALAQPYGMNVYTDYKEMVKREHPDIVIITVPHYLHKETTLWCLAQGCHVFIEKPMAMYVQECTEMIEAARNRNLILAVGHMQHYFPANMKAREIIESGQLGKLVMINDRRHGHYFRADRPTWFLDRARSGGGIVMNLGSHSIDKIQWITNSPVTKVLAKLTYYGERGNVEGSGSLSLQTAQGVTANVSLCGYHTIAENKTELFFTEGQLQIRDRNGLWISGKNREYEPVKLDPLPDPFLAQWRDMLRAIEHRFPLGISGDYGRSVVAVIEAAYRSHEVNKEQHVQQYYENIVI